MGVYGSDSRDSLQDSQPVHVGEHDVEDQHVGVDLLELSDRLAPVVGDLDGPALIVQRHLHQVGQRRLVVDQQNPDRMSRRGDRSGAAAREWLGAAVGCPRIPSLRSCS